MNKENKISYILKSILAGILIALGAFANIKSGMGIIGAFLFSLGLISVCVLECNLYTGKIGYINKATYKKTILYCLPFNLISAFVTGVCLNGLVDCNIPQTKLELWQTKPISMFIGSMMCGICVYLAVELYKRTKNYLGIIIPVMVFVLCSFSHCVADTAYLGFAIDNFDIRFLIVIFLVAAGNSLGAIITHKLLTINNK